MRRPEGAGGALRGAGPCEGQPRVESSRVRGAQSLPCPAGPQRARGGLGAGGGRPGVPQRPGAGLAPRSVRGLASRSGLKGRPGAVLLEG